MHATMLRSISDVQRLAGRPYTSCNLFETVYRVV